MGTLPNWQCFLACSCEAAAVPVAEYLRMHDCPALVFPLPVSCELPPGAAVMVPQEFLARARHVWEHADMGGLTEGELEYLATGKLPGAAEPLQHDDAA